MELKISQNILWQWICWHFFDVPKELIRAWKNFLLFNLNYFSVPILLKTFFSYWRRYKWSYGRGFDLKRYFEAFTFNLISRILGACVRGILIFIGIIAEVFIFIGGIIVFAGWLLLPAFLIIGLFYGFKILF